MLTGTGTVLIVLILLSIFLFINLFNFIFVNSISLSLNLNLFNKSSFVLFVNLSNSSIFDFNVSSFISSFITLIVK